MFEIGIDKPDLFKFAHKLLAAFLPLFGVGHVGNTSPLDHTELREHLDLKLRHSEGYSGALGYLHGGKYT